MSNNIFYVYVHFDTLGNPRYVGKGKGRRAFSNFSRNPYWKNIFKNYLPDVEFICKNMSEQDAFELEKEMIKIYREDGYKLCNFTDGGEGSSGYKHSNECKKMMSELAKERGWVGEKNPMYSRNHSLESRKKISEKGKGKKIGNKNPFYGKKHPDKLMKKIAKAHTKTTKKDRENIKKRVKHGETHQKLAEEYNVSRATITNIVNNKYSQ